MKYLIIGGVAGGATVAARLRRMDEKAEIILFERGKYVSYANCGLPYYIGDTINDRNKLFVQTVSFWASSPRATGWTLWKTGTGSRSPPKWRWRSTRPTRARAL